MISKHKVVKLDYTVKDDDGELVDTTIGDEPLEYMHGAEQIIDGLEAALEGKKVSESFKVRVEPDQAYGYHQEELVSSVDISTFKEIAPENIEVGMTFSAQADFGEVEVAVTEVDLENGTVIVDGNHPLAGLALTFEGQILEVRDASEVEIKQALTQIE